MARSSNGGAQNRGAQNGGAQRKPPVPLTLVDQGDQAGDDDETYIVVGEAGEDVAFEVCEDLEIALGVREAMQEDGFAVRLYQAVEIEVVADDAPGSPGGHAA
jgi:hypothetical protein